MRSPEFGGEYSTYLQVYLRVVVRNDVMKNIMSLIFLILTLLVLQAFSQTMPGSYFEETSGQLEYGFFVPENYDSGQKYPLLMFLHGMGNNYTVYLDWYRDEIQSITPCFIYTPKTPTSWGDWSGWNDYSLSAPMKVAMDILDSMIDVYSIDTNRLYVYGISMGGEGVFDLFHKLPGKFAAGMSVCGGGQSWWADSIAKTPFWMFHGGSDNINPPELTERVYNELQKIGAYKSRYTRYEGYGHSIWDRAAAEPSWFDWMFSFNKSDTVYPKPTGVLNLQGIGGDSIRLSWNDSRNPDDKGNKIWYYAIYNKDGLIGTTEFNRTEYAFKPVHQVDTFTVVAINYYFQQSTFSNRLFYQNDTFSVNTRRIQRKTNLSIFNKNSKLHISTCGHNFKGPVTVSVVSLDGRCLFNRVYVNKPTVTIDITRYRHRHLIIRVSDKKSEYVKRVFIE